MLTLLKGVPVLLRISQKGFCGNVSDGINQLCKIVTKCAKTDKTFQLKINILFLI
jgi:hypothetical protein